MQFSNSNMLSYFSHDCNTPNTVPPPQPYWKACEIPQKHYFTFRRSWTLISATWEWEWGVATAVRHRIPCCVRGVSKKMCGLLPKYAPFHNDKNGQVPAQHCTRIAAPFTTKQQEWKEWEWTGHWRTWQGARTQLLKQRRYRPFETTVKLRRPTEQARNFTK